MRRLAPLLALALAGCGSAPAAELPAPAGPPASPMLIERPAGRVEPIPSEAELTADSTLDRAGDRLRLNGRTTRTCREPIASASVERGAQIAVLCGRERVVDVYDAKSLERLGRVGAGIGPTGLATNGVELLYVTDVLGEALLVYSLRPLQLIRRVHLGSGPYAIAYDRGHFGLWITLPAQNQVVHYSAGTRPVIRETLPAIRDARAIAVARDQLTVLSDREVQSLRLRRK